MTDSGGLAVIFDMDGLMLDTERLSLGAWQETAAALGHPVSEALCKGMMGLGQAEVAAYLTHHFQDARLAREVAQGAQVRLAAELAQNGAPVKAGLFDLLGFLGRQATPKAVATSTPATRATGMLTRAGILPLVDALVTGDQVAHGKPSPDIYLLAAQRLGYRPECCVALEDSGPGIRSAAAAGMRVIFVPDICIVDQATQRLAFATAPSLAEAQTIIEGLVSQAASP
jgi:beta-phosphoglucomutase-like phosphatase (HAD superfamily)